MKNFNDVISGVDEVLNSAKHGNFEDVLTKTKSYAERATKKSAERLEISRKKIELLDSRTKLTKAYEKYGRLQYSAYLGEELDEEAIESALQEIQLQKTRAELLDKEVAELREAFVEGLSKREARQYARQEKKEEETAEDSAQDE
ncbi:MAG: hypothetical protein IJ235_06340 [Eubacterium sp.]|nr:hypothetical protein [Eubacterium sp.]MBR2278948.1 hypothetical protein [Eubacterium sp.]